MKDSTKKSLKSLVELIDEQYREVVQSGLKMLFPNLPDQDIGGRRLFAPMTGVPGSASRLHIKEFSRNYFALSSDRITLSREQLSGLSDPDKFSETIIDITKNTLRSPTLTNEYKTSVVNIVIKSINSFFDQTSPTSENIITVITLSPTILKYNTFKGRGFFQLTSTEILRGAIVRAIDKLQLDQQIVTLQDSINLSDDLTMISEISRSFFGDEASSGGAKGRFSEGLPPLLAEVRGTLYAKALNKLGSEDFWDQFGIPEVIFLLRGGGFTHELQRAIYAMLRDKSPSCVKLLNAMPNLVVSTAGDYELVNDAWWQFVDKQQIREYAEFLFSSDDEEERAIARRFMEAVDRKSDF